MVTGEVKVNDEKLAVARRAAQAVIDSGIEVLGVGSGTTVEIFIEELSKMNFKGYTVPTSIDTIMTLKKHGFKVLDLLSVDEVEMSVDGADEVSEDLTLIKGGGAAMLREKVLAHISKYRLYIVDSSKFVKKPCSRGVPIPIEVVPYALSAVTKSLTEMGIRWVMRKAKGKLGPIISDNGNIVIDLNCEDALDKIETVERLPGVAVSGLFPRDLVDEVLIGSEGRLRR